MGTRSRFLDAVGKSSNDNVKLSRTEIHPQSCLRLTFHTRAACMKAVPRVAMAQAKMSGGGVTSRGFENTLRKCYHIFRRTEPKITDLDWRQLGLEKLSSDDIVVCDPPYPAAQTKCYSHETVDYDALVDVLLGARFRWILCGYPHPLLHRLGEPIWARDMDLLCVRMKNGKEQRNECVWANFAPAASKSRLVLPPTVRGQIRSIADATSLSFRALDARIDSGLEQVAKDFTKLVPYLLEMHRRLSAPGKRMDLRQGAPMGLTWTEWVESKRHKLGRGLRSIQYLLKGRTESSLRRQTLVDARSNLANNLRSVTTQVPPDTPLEIGTAMSHLVLDMRSNGGNTPANKRKLECLAQQFLRTVKGGQGSRSKFDQVALESKYTM